MYPRAHEQATGLDGNSLSQPQHACANSHGFGHQSHSRLHPRLTRGEGRNISNGLSMLAQVNVQVNVNTQDSAPNLGHRQIEYPRVVLWQSFLGHLRFTYSVYPVLNHRRQLPLLRTLVPPRFPLPYPAIPVGPAYLGAGQQVLTSYYWDSSHLASNVVNLQINPRPFSTTSTFSDIPILINSCRSCIFSSPASRLFSSPPTSIDAPFVHSHPRSRTLTSAVCKGK